jgi:hypothetical protein
MSFAAGLVGPAVSAIGGLFKRGGGSNASQATQNSLAGQKNLQDVFNYANPTGQAGYNAGNATTTGGLATTAQGASTLASPLNYWQKIASGNRPAVMQAVQPETNALQQQGDAARRQAVASGTARGGGLAGPMEEQKTGQMSQIDNLLASVRAAAPAAISDIGKTQAGIGLSTAQIGQDQVAKALQMLGLGTSAAAESSDLANKLIEPTSKNNAAFVNQMAGAGTDIATGIINSIFGKKAQAPA